jgi:hypothetical protein
MWSHYHRDGRHIRESCIVSFMAASDHLGQQWWHGTTSANADAIQREGLRATWAGNYTLHVDRNAAHSYAQDAADELGGSPAVVGVQIPSRIAAAYLDVKTQVPEEVEDGTRRAWLRRTVPPRYITR